MSTMMLVGVCFLACLIAEALLYILAQKDKREKTVGKILINKSDPMKDTYTLELSVPFGELDQMDEVIFKIQHE